MITCRELAEFLDRYVEGELDSQEQRIFHEHLSGCPDCVNYVESYERTHALSRATLADNDAPATVAPGELVRAILKARSAE